ncbi:MAG: ankyrin repeat domain-containing protein [Treponema sp.]|nr:ankyrin repeat domain-containing protein [Treponema sp.]
MTIAELLKDKKQSCSKIEQNLNEKRFFDAVKSRNRDAVRQLINKGIDVNIKDEDGWTALMLATLHGDNDKTVRLLIELGAELDVQNDDGETALMCATIVKATKSAKLLISNNANVNIKNKNGKTALMLAIEENANEIKEMLISLGAEKNSRNNEEENANCGFNEKTKNESTYNSDKIKISGSSLNNAKAEIMNEQEAQSLSNHNEVQEFFNNEFNKDFGTILDIKILQTEYFDRFNSTFNNNDLQEEIKNNNSKNKFKNIENLGNGVYRVIPSKEVKKEFFSSEFNKNFGYTSDIKTKYIEKYNYELLDDILKQIIQYFNEELPAKKIIQLDDKTIQIVPSDDEIQKFLTLEFSNVHGKIIYKSTITKKYENKYNSYLDDKFLLNQITIFNQSNQSKKVIKLDELRLTLAPTGKAFNEILKSIFCNTKYGYITDVKDRFREKCLCELTEDILDKFINDFNTHLCNRKILKGSDADWVKIVPNDKEIQYFLKSEFNNAKYGYITDAKAKFREKYRCELSDDIFNKFIDSFNSQVGNKQIKNLDVDRVQIVPSNNEVQNFLLTELHSKKYGYINEIKSKFNKKYACELNGEEIITYINSQPHDFSLVKSDNEKIQVLSKLPLNLAAAIQKKFLGEKIMFSCSMKDLIENPKQNYVFCSLSRNDIISAIQIANSNLKDIQIVLDNTDNIKSCFKGSEMSCSNFDTKMCPVCGEDFSECTSVQIKTHLLQIHTSKNQNESILVKTGRKTLQTDEEIFSCNHCKKKFALYNYNVSVEAIYAHLLGICKESSSEHVSIREQRINENSSEHGIWKGFGYANNSTFLGNSGQLLRDNRRFGSFPIEDYYGDGD